MRFSIKAGDIYLVEEGKVSIGEKKQDVVIIGAGMAGFVAAIEGVANGAQVTVLDKLDRTKALLLSVQG